MSSRILVGDCREVLATLPEASVQCVVTSPPYFGLRDYGVSGQIGLEVTVEDYVAQMVAVFRGVRRVLRDDGTVWLNLGDTYAGGGAIGRNDTTPEALARRAKKYGTGQASGSFVGNHETRPPVAGLKPKDLIGIPWRVAFALQADGWYLRSDIIWHKPNPMPERVTDRPTKAHEYVFLLTKAARYYYDVDAVREPFVTKNGMGWAKAVTTQDTMKVDGDNCHQRSRVGGGMVPMKPGVGGRNRRSVWTIATKPYAEAHFATFPPALVEPCIKAGSKPGDVVLDPFAGAGTTLLVAARLGRNSIGLELNPTYAELAAARIRRDAPMLTAVEVSA